jgi:hypothetical protein
MNSGEEEGSMESEAEECFKKASEIARRQSAKLLELRAARSAQDEIFRTGRPSH